MTNKIIFSFDLEDYERENNTNIDLSLKGKYTQIHFWCLKHCLDCCVCDRLTD